eukprot:s2795_g7.t1
MALIFRLNSCLLMPAANRLSVLSARYCKRFFSAASVALSKIRPWKIGICRCMRPDALAARKEIARLLGHLPMIREYREKQKSLRGGPPQNRVPSQGPMSARYVPRPPMARKQAWEEPPKSARAANRPASRQEDVVDRRPATPRTPRTPRTPNRRPATPRQEPPEAPRRPRSAAGFLMEAQVERLEVPSGDPESSPPTDRNVLDEAWYQQALKTAAASARLGFAAMPLEDEVPLKKDREEAEVRKRYLGKLAEVGIDPEGMTAGDILRTTKLGLQLQASLNLLWLQGGKAMPSPWREVGERAYKEYTPARFEILELVVYSDDLTAQGTSLVGVLKKGERLPSGLGFPGVFLGASDEYYRFWATEGEGRALVEKGTYHLCEVRVADCPQWKRRANVVHSDKFRTVGPSEVRDGKISWLRSKENRERVVAALDKFEARVKRRSVTEEAMAPLEGSEDESDGSSSSSGDSEEVRARLKRLKAELQVAQKKADKKSKKKDRTRKSRGRSVSRKKDKKDETKKKGRRSPSSEEKAERKAAKKRKAKGGREEEPKKAKKKKMRETEEHSEEESSGSSEMKQKELFKSSPPSKSLEKKPGLDRGPFGGGPALAYGKSDQSSDSEAESVFRDAPTRTTTQSGQQKLSRYSQRYPGRLASRLLIKMRETSARDLVGAHNEDTSTPPLASHFLLTVLIPALGQKASLRTQRELRTLGKGLDLLAKGQAGQCADLLGQRIKALDRASQEGHWASAQYLELLPPDGVTLLERDEELYLRQEYIIDRKAKQYEKQPLFPPRPPKGEGKGDRPQKGKGGGKDARPKPQPTKPADDPKK